MLNGKRFSIQFIGNQNILKKQIFKYEQRLVPVLSGEHSAGGSAYIKLIFQKKLNRSENLTLLHSASS